jgi:hypothetical protein
MAKYSSALDEFEKRFVKPQPGRTLIVGSKVYRGKPDRRLLYPDAIGIDMEEGDGVDLVMDLEQKQPLWTLFDHVECMSVLEHSRRPWMLAETIETLMAPGATIFISVPWIWRYHAYPKDYFRFSPDGIEALFPNIEWEYMMIASDALRERGKNVPAVTVEGHVHLARAETVGFGRLKA